MQLELNSEELVGICQVENGRESIRAKEKQE